MKAITFYLDFISPYAYLAFETMPEVLEDSQPASVVEFIEAAAWDRLVQVDPDAERVAAAQTAFARATQ